MEREIGKKREKFYLSGGAFLWGYSEAFYEFDHFVGDVFFFAVHCDHVIALVQLDRAFFGTG
jgi:hypothetical protein